MDDDAADNNAADDDAADRFRQFNTVRVPAVLIPQGGDPAAAIRAGIVHPVRIPVRIVTRGRARQTPADYEKPTSRES